MLSKLRAYWSKLFARRQSTSASTENASNLYSPPGSYGNLKVGSVSHQKHSSTIERPAIKSDEEDTAEFEVKPPDPGPGNES